MNERFALVGAMALAGCAAIATESVRPAGDRFTPVDRKYRGDKGRGNSDSLKRMLSRAKRRG